VPLLFHAYLQIIGQTQVVEQTNKQKSERRHNDVGKWSLTDIRNISWDERSLGKRRWLNKTNKSERRVNDV